MPNNDEKKVLLKVTDLKQWFPLKKTKLFQKEQEYVRANDGITLNIYEGNAFLVFSVSQDLLHYHGMIRIL